MDTRDEIWIKYKTWVEGLCQRLRAKSPFSYDQSLLIIYQKKIGKILREKPTHEKRSKRQFMGRTIAQKKGKASFETRWLITWVEKPEQQQEILNGVFTPLQTRQVKYLTLGTSIESYGRICNGTDKHMSKISYIPHSLEKKQHDNYLPNCQFTWAKGHSTSQIHLTGKSRMDWGSVEGHSKHMAPRTSRKN